MSETASVDPVMLISVIIPVYNGAKTLPLVLAGLAKQTLAPGQFEVIVTNDCSTDDTPRILAETATPYRLVTLTQPENRGASAARNRAAGQAQGRYLVFIDADCVPDPALLQTHLTVLQAQTGPVGTVGRIVWSKEFEGGPLSEFYKKLYFPDLEALRTSDGELPEVPFTTFVTSNAALPRALFQELGGFDEDFRYLWDDTVLGYRLHQLGGRLLLNREAVVYHHRPLLPAEAFARYRRQGQEAMRLLAKYPELTSTVVQPGEILVDPYLQEELYQLMARYALGLGYQEGAGKYFGVPELEQLRDWPELNTEFETWRDQRLALYRTDLQALRTEHTSTQAYVKLLEAAYQRELQRKTQLENDLVQEKSYSRKLEQTQGYAPTGFNPGVVRQQFRRGWRRGYRGVQQWLISRRKTRQEK